jgi:uncharacterized membrane protein YqjE
VAKTKNPPAVKEMKILPVAIVAVVCYTVGMIHGRWQVLSRIEDYLIQIEKNESTLDRKIPTPNFI